MELLEKAGGWLSQVTGVAVGLLALAVVLQVLFGAPVPFFPVDVVGNVIGVVGQLGSEGLVGLVAVGVLAHVMTKKD